MPDFYADHPFPEVVVKIADAAKFCSVGDCVAGMKSGIGRVERFVDGGILVHPTRSESFQDGDVVVSATGSALIAGISAA